MPEPLPTVSVTELQELLQSADKSTFLLDVRRADEFSFCNIGGHHIPMQELQGRLSELPSDVDTTIAVLCRSGGRSARVTSFLIASGFGNVRNVKGGILAWSDEIDSSIKKY